MAKSIIAITALFLLLGCISPDSPRGTSLPLSPSPPKPPSPTFTVSIPQPSPYFSSAFTPSVNISYSSYQPSPSPTPNPENITNFLAWAAQHNISIVGINKSTDHFYFNDTTPDDFLDPGPVPGLLNIADGLYKIHEPLLRVMNGKTFYVSHQYGRGYTILGSWPEQHILAGVNRGSILEQPLTGQQAVHEFAHILDYHGIRGSYNDSENHWPHLEPLRAEIFAVPFTYDPNRPDIPAGYMDVYSTANDAENFAQHFTFYIYNGAEFREKARSDALLKRKYDFFRDQLFDGREY